MLLELLAIGGASFRPAFQERSQSSTTEQDAKEAASSVPGREAEDEKVTRELSIGGHAVIHSTIQNQEATATATTRSILFLLDLY